METEFLPKAIVLLARKVTFCREDKLSENHLKNTSYSRGVSSSRNRLEIQSSVQRVPNEIYRAVMFAELYDVFYKRSAR